MLSVRAILATYLRSFFILKDNKSGFSIHNWVKDDTQKGFLFLHGIPKQRSELCPLWSVWFNIAFKSIMDLNPHSNRRVWFIVDELASLNKLPSLDMALAEGRKYGACIVLGFQNMAQIQEIYGIQGVKSMRELMVSKFAFQAVDHENAKLLSKIFGDHRYSESHESISYGANEIRDGINLSYHKKREALVGPQHLMSLKPLHFYAKIADQNLCLKSAFSYYKGSSKNMAFLEKSRKEETIAGILERRGNISSASKNKEDTHNEIENIILFQKEKKELTVLTTPSLKEKDNGYLKIPEGLV